MTRSLSEIQKQILALQAEADKLISEERGKAIAEVKAKIAEFGLTAKDLGLGEVKPAARKGKGSLPAKYFGPDGQGWSGRGRKPEWIKTALAEGKSLDQFKISD